MFIFHVHVHGRLHMRNNRMQEVYERKSARRSDSFFVVMMLGHDVGWCCVASPKRFSRVIRQGFLIRRSCRCCLARTQCDRETAYTFSLRFYGASDDMQCRGLIYSAHWVQIRYQQCDRSKNGCALSIWIRLGWAYDSVRNNIACGQHGHIVLEMYLQPGNQVWLCLRHFNG